MSIHIPEMLPKTALRLQVPAFSTIVVSALFLTAGAEGLRDAAAKVNIYFGTEVPGNPSTLSYSSIVKNEFNMLVCENAMKWDATEGSKGNFNYNGGDQVATFCTSNGYKMRGHTMVWYAQTPSWVQGLNRTEMLAAMKNHITTLMNHFKGKILEWDICNECVADGSSSLRNSFWKSKIGEDFIDSAFVYAHQADTNVYLYYNDYGGESAGSVKSDYIYNMVKGMKQRGIPIHGVGLQCHLGAPVNKANISKNIKRLGELGLRVSCTEIDIGNGTGNPSSWANLVDACTENFNATSFLTWGVSDANSWKGSGCNCLIWNTSYQAKTQVYDAVKTAFEDGDDDVAEKRKKFMALSPGALLKGGVGTITSKKQQVPAITLSKDVFYYSLPVNRTVNIKIIDMRGRMVVDLVQKVETAGRHSVNLHNRSLPAGLFFVKIRSGNECMSIPYTRLD
jgi:endo-1,4-beta-xylanase